MRENSETNNNGGNTFFLFIVNSKVKQGILTHVTCVKPQSEGSTVRKDCNMLHPPAVWIAPYNIDNEKCSEKILFGTLKLVRILVMMKSNVVLSKLKDLGITTVVLQPDKSWYICRRLRHDKRAPLSKHINDKRVIL